jgi:hypothetical protein
MSMPSSLFGSRTPMASMPISQPTPQQSQQINPQILEMYQRLSRSSNPNLEIQKMLANDPRLAPISRLSNLFKGDFKAAFFDEARRRGIDPNTINPNMLMSMFAK